MQIAAYFVGMSAGGTERTFGEWGLKSAAEGKTDFAKR
jgi:hypothetical protein